MLPRILLFVSLLMFMATPSFAGFYTWTDRDGREFYTNEKDKIPEAYRESARPVDMQEERVSVGTGSAGTEKVTRVKPHKDRYGRGEAYWHGRAEALRRQLGDQQAARDRIAQEEKADERSGKSASARRKAHAAREKKKAKIAEKIDRLTHELDVELPEEARKADALPGWLR
jgi:hypothetical protein